jgi:hypothetical protein
MLRIELKLIVMNDNLQLWASYTSGLFLVTIRFQHRIGLQLRFERFFTFLTIRFRTLIHYQ